MSKHDRLARREDCVLVIIDAQEKLLPVIHEQAAVVANMAKLVKFAAIAGLPVVVTEQMKLGATVAEVAEPAGAAAIGKISFDCFGCEDFVQKIKELKRKTLVLCGVEAHICVVQTALGALEDFRVQVVSDAVSSRAPHNWLVALERLRQAGCVITSTEMFIYEILRQAGTDEFKATLPLVK
ncbi:MAG: isochorismatase family protein [Pseudomonadota bacterium]